MSRDSQYKKEMEIGWKEGNWLDKFVYAVYVFKTAQSEKMKEVVAPDLPALFASD